MNISDRQQLIDITIDLNNLLTQYIDIHNSFLKAKFNLRYVLPIPFLFKPIDYRDLHERAEEVLENLNYLNSQVGEIEKGTVSGENEYITTLNEYIARLKKTIELLTDILYKLYQKSQGDGSYSHRQYGKDMEDYNVLVQDYSNYGYTLNIKFNEFKVSIN